MAQEEGARVFSPLRFGEGLPPAPLAHIVRATSTNPRALLSVRIHRGVQGLGERMVRPCVRRDALGELVPGDEIQRHEQVDVDRAGGTTDAEVR